MPAYVIIVNLECVTLPLNADTPVSRTSCRLHNGNSRHFKKSVCIFVTKTYLYLLKYLYIDHCQGILFLALHRVVELVERHSQILFDILARCCEQNLENDETKQCIKSIFLNIKYTQHYL